MKTIQEVCKEQINKFKDFMLELVVDDFREKGEIQPAVYALIMKGNGTCEIATLNGIGELFSTPQGKEMAAHIIRESAKHIKPIALAFISEAWIARVEESDIFDEKGQPRKNIPTANEIPDKIEGVFVNIETFDKEYLKMWKVVDNGLDRTLSDDSNNAEWVAKNRRIPTVFGDLLAENYSEMAKILETTLKVNPN